MFGRDVSRRHHRRHRLDALALAWHQQPRAIIPERPRPVLAAQNRRQVIDIPCKTRFARLRLRLHLPRHSPFRRISKIANPAVGRICENRNSVVLGGAA